MLTVGTCSTEQQWLLGLDAFTLIILLVNSMRDFRFFIGIAGGMALVAGSMEGCSKAVAQQAPNNAPDRSIELTVYKDDFAMVSERRPVAASAGHSQVVLDDISKALDPNSVLLDWPGSKSHPDVVATTYNMGVGNGSSLISRLNGKEVSLMWASTDGKPGEMVTGRLETAQGGGDFSLRTPDKLYVNPTGTIVADANTPSTLPQLSVELNSPSGTFTTLGLSYLTRGMSWSADYTAKLNPSNNTAELECWATITNRTGTAFPSARITLMAGEPNRAAQTANFGSDPTLVMGGSASTGTVTLQKARVNSPMVQGYLSAADGDSATRNAARLTVGDMYAYQIPNAATIGMDQMNRVSVLGTRTVPVKRTYTIAIPELGADGYSESGVEGNGQHVSAVTSMAFVNEKGSNLGITLPSGAVRVYERDASGRERYTGADEISDTPKGEHVTLHLSNAFDVYGSYRVLKSERISKHVVRKTVETDLFNEKKSSADLRVFQAFSSRWTLDAESSKGERPDASTSEWKLTLKPGEHKALTYTVDLKV